MGGFHHLGALEDGTIELGGFRGFIVEPKAIGHFRHGTLAF
jgi:hypothetical protein